MKQTEFNKLSTDDKIMYKLDKLDMEKSFWGFWDGIFFIMIVAFSAMAALVILREISLLKRIVYFLIPFFAIMMFLLFVINPIKIKKLDKKYIKEREG